MSFETWLNAHPEGSRRAAYEAGLEEGRGQATEAEHAISALSVFIDYVKREILQTQGVSSAREFLHLGGEGGKKNS